jgi:hypothetical protein
VLIVAVTSGANARALDMAVSGDFDGDGKLDKFEYVVDPLGMEIDYYPTSTGKKNSLQSKGF